MKDEELYALFKPTIGEQSCLRGYFGAENIKDERVSRKDIVRAKLDAFVIEYTKHFDAVRAAETIGCKNPKTAYHTLIKSKYVIRRVQEVLAKREVNSEVNAEYVKGCLQQIIELNPLMFFDEQLNGTLKFNYQRYLSLPPNLQRLVEVEVTTTRGLQTIRVSFPSKMAALSLLARHTLPTKVQIQEIPSLPWKEIAEATQIIDHEEIERRLEDESKSDEESSGSGERVVA